MQIQHSERNIIVHSELHSLDCGKKAAEFFPGWNCVSTNQFDEGQHGNPRLRGRDRQAARTPTRTGPGESNHKPSTEARHRGHQGGSASVAYFILLLPPYFHGKRKQGSPPCAAPCPWTMCGDNAGLMLGQRLRRWLSIRPALRQRLAFVGIWLEVYRLT